MVPFEIERWTQNALLASFDRKLRRFVSGPEKCLTRNSSLSNSALLGREISNEFIWDGAILRARICFCIIRDIGDHVGGQLTGWVAFVLPILGYTHSISRSAQALHFGLVSSHFFRRARLRGEISKEGSVHGFGGL